MLIWLLVFVVCGEIARYVFGYVKMKKRFTQEISHNSMNTSGIICNTCINTILSTWIPHSLYFYDSTQLVHFAPSWKVALRRTAHE